jgi:dynein assembly factor 3, axonemal
VREFTRQFIETKANEYIKYITDEDYLIGKHGHFFDFTLLKYKERDFLEGIFKFWRGSKNTTTTTTTDPFPATKCWDLRLRAYFQQRYDSRSNAYDWDFSMKIIEREHASIINRRCYSRWRETGIAYELRDTTYDHSNKTMASVLALNDPKSGDKTVRRG